MNQLLDLSGNDLYKPGSVFLIFDKAYTYDDFINNVTRQAGYFYTKGIKSHDVVPLISSNNPYFLISVFALWKLGAVPALINTRLKELEINSIRNFIKPRNVLVEPGSGYPGISTYVNKETPGKAELPVIDSDISKTALILFTSGTTGKPKGVELSFSNLLSSSANANSYLSIQNGNSWLASLPFYHVGGFSIVVRALLSGSPVIIPESSSAESLCKTINKYKPAYVSLVSTQLKQLIDMNCNNLEGISKILLGGGFIDDKLINTALEKGLKLFKGYGSTETASFVTALDCSNEKKLSSSGQAVSDNEIIITGSNNELLPAGTTGEILIKGRTVSQGYYKNPEATADKFRNGYFHTGDIGYLDEEGYLFVLARRTDLIISGGENINPNEVEAALLKHSDIKEAVVIGIEDKKWGHTPVAVIVTDNKLLNQQVIKQFLQDKIAGFKIPTRITIVDEIPKTSLGKVQREKLKELFE